MTATPDSWNPDQYGKYRDERAAPFFDLLTLVQARPGMRVVDLGCGTGELTHRLHEQMHARESVGIDRSPAMLTESGAYQGAGLHFEQGDIATFASDTSYDLVFSNAALQWVPEHEQLLGQLTAVLAKGGQLAVQVPANHEQPSQTVAAEVAAEAPFCDALGGYVRRSPVLAPEQYALLLHRLGFNAQHVRLQVYGHLLPSPGDVVEWVKGTVLTDYESRLPPELFAKFLQRFRARLLPCLEDASPYFFAFRRILFWARM
jgi:trans-aconitate 2-methyltransferase